MIDDNHLNFGLRCPTLEFEQKKSIENSIGGLPVRSCFIFRVTSLTDFTCVLSWGKKIYTIDLHLDRM